MKHIKHAVPEYPINALISKRWSPYVFADRAVAEEDLRSIFEAARWAASSYNEQPWRFIVAAREDDHAFSQILSCLVEQNQAWAQHAPVLALGVVSTRFSRNGKPNPVAIHDLGLAAATLTLEATDRGLSVHQMAGIVPDRAREVYEIPSDYEAITALAIGYAGNPDDGPTRLADLDRSPRNRRPLSESVFSGTWGKKAGWA